MLKMGLGKGCCPRLKMGLKEKVILEKKMGLGRGCGPCCLRVKILSKRGCGLEKMLP